MEPSDEKSSDAPRRAQVPLISTADVRAALTPLYKSPRRLTDRKSSDPYEQMMQSGTTVLMLADWDTAQADELLRYLNQHTHQRIDWFREGLQIHFLSDGNPKEVRDALKQRLNHPLPPRAGRYTLEDIERWSNQEILERPSSSRSMRDSP